MRTTSGARNVSSNWQIGYEMSEFADGLVPSYENN